jgi:sulfonate transport system permease protein
MPQQSSSNYYPDDTIAEGPGAPATLGSEYLTGASVAAAPRSGWRPPGRRRGPVVLWGAVFPILLLGAWQWISTAGIIPAYRLPTPTAVYLAAIDLAQRGLLFPDIQISTQRVLLGFAFGAVAGLVVGAILGLSRWASLLFAPTIGGFRAVPSLAWVPLLILYLGINEDQKVLLIAVGAFFPVYTTVAGALRHVDRQLVEVGRAYGRKRVSLLLAVQLPAIVPTVVSGLRLALAQSWLFLVAAELIASSMGLGFLLKDSQDNGRIDRLFVAIILLAVLGKATDTIIGLFERYLLRRWS